MRATTSFIDFAAACRVAPPDVAFVLGSGLGPVARRLRATDAVAFADVPGLPATGVVGHKGCLTLGDWAGRRVLVFEGRVHFYEGHTWQDVTAPVRVAASLGARVLLLTNAAGGIHHALAPGSLMAIRDHIEWTRAYCWRLPGPGALGAARPSPYSPRLLGLLDGAARAVGVALRPGVYAMVTGPSFETPAEIRALRSWGADAVGMSTAREIQAAYDAGLECAAVSCVTNQAAGLGGGPLSHEEVLTTAAAQSGLLADLLDEFLRRL